MSLYEQLGGAEPVRRFVDDLSARVLIDPLLGPAFDELETSKIEQHREYYLTVLLGGPEIYEGRGMREAHRPLQLEERDVARFMQIASDCLSDAGVEDDLAAAVLQLLEKLRSAIISPTGLTGPIEISRPILEE